MSRKIFDPPHLLEHFPVPNFHWGLREGDTIYLAGQGGIDKQGNVPAGLGEQTKLALESIQETLEALGSTNEDIVSMSLFFNGTDGPSLGEALQEFVGVKDGMWPSCVPVGLAVPVSELFFPGLLVEIQVIAVANSSSAE